MGKVEPWAEEKIDQKLKELPGWKREGSKLVRTFRAPTFLDAMKQVNRVAEMAEKVDHHPDISIHYREVTFSLWTHVANGVTEKDFHLAKMIDQVWMAEK